MNLGWKLTLNFLLVSLLTAGSVGITAWWLIKQDFRDAVEQHAFEDFRDDITAYIKRYGDWETAQASQTFSDFVEERHQTFSPALPPAPGLTPRSALIDLDEPSFEFLLLTPDGRIARSVGDYVAGGIVSEAIFEVAKPIKINNKVVFFAAPLGEPMLTEEDRIILTFLKRSLIIGLGVGAVVALLLGVLLSHRVVGRLRKLVDALNRMHPDSAIPDPVIINTHDEIGLLAKTYNRMSRQLIEAHQNLKASNATINAQAEELRELSLRDSLTGLYNRRYFDEQAHVLFQQAIRYQHPLCVMIADLDHFKNINDNHSHAVGDGVLSRTAAILQGNIRSSDLLVRYGGEEFVAIFTESNLAQTHDRCEILRQCIEQESWDELSPGLRVTLSIGLCDDMGLGSVAGMMKCADENLYRAKNSGRNRVVPEPSPLDHKPRLPMKKAN